MNKRILVAFYEGNEEPIILISTESLEMIALIKSVFEDLSQKRYREFQFQDIEHTQFEGLEALTLRVIDGDKNPRKALECVKVSPLSEFCWVQTSEGWNDSAWWIDGILKLKTPGHQYFTNKTDHDDALITISFGEGH